MNRCYQCEIWYDYDVERRCPRLSKAYAQGNGLILKLKSSDKKLEKTVVFEGTGMYSEACEKFIEKVSV